MLVIYPLLFFVGSIRSVRLYFSMTSSMNSSMNSPNFMKCWIYDFIFWYIFSSTVFPLKKNSDLTWFFSLYEKIFIEKILTSILRADFNIKVCLAKLIKNVTGWPKSYRKYILKITQPPQYGYAKSQYRFSVTSGSPSTISIVC